MNNRQIITVLLGAFLLLQACAPSRFVKPLAEDEKALSFGFGGPFVDYDGTNIPLPLTSIALGYGLDSNLTLFGGLHTTALLFGNLQLDLGASYGILEQDKYIPGISISPVINIIIDLNDRANRLWPQADLNFYWTRTEKEHCLYVGASNWFELRKTRSNDQEQIQRWLFNPHLGYTHKLKNMDLNIEFKFLAPGADNRYAFVPYKSLLGTRGATGLYISAIKRF